jgi:hypothetical protein
LIALPASDSRVRTVNRRWALPIVAVVAVVAALVARVAITSGDDLVYQPTARQWVLVSCMVLITVVATVATGFFRLWLFWRPAPKEPVVLALAQTGLALFVLIEMFVSITALLASSGVVSVSGFEFIGRSSNVVSGSGFATTYWGPAGSQIYRSIEALYFWHLLDAIPALDIPKTLNWTPAHGLNDHIGGALVLTFKVLVVLPVITLAKTLFTTTNQHGDGDADNSPS